MRNTTVDDIPNQKHFFYNKPLITTSSMPSTWVAVLSCWNFKCVFILFWIIFSGELLRHIFLQYITTTFFSLHQTAPKRISKIVPPHSLLYQHLIHMQTILDATLAEQVGGVRLFRNVRGTRDGAGIFKLWMCHQMKRLSAVTNDLIKSSMQNRFLRHNLPRLTS